jgi:hypothetical protein
MKIKHTDSEEHLIKLIEKEFGDNVPNVQELTDLFLKFYDNISIKGRIPKK